MQRAVHQCRSRRGDDHPFGCPLPYPAARGRWSAMKNPRAEIVISTPAAMLRPQSIRAEWAQHAGTATDCA